MKGGHFLTVNGDLGSILDDFKMRGIHSVLGKNKLFISNKWTPDLLLPYPYSPIPTLRKVDPSKYEIRPATISHDKSTEDEKLYSSKRNVVLH
jgi:hypothetical protein